MKIDKAKVRYIDNLEDNELKTNKNNSRVSTYTEDFKGEYYNIKLEKLIPFRNQARIHFDEESLNSLAQTIKVHGIRQPLTVIPSEEKEGFYEIVSGERRYRAAKILKMLTVPCIIIHDKKRAEEIAIIENIQRKDLHPVELMKAYTNLLKNNICKSYSEISNKVGVSKSSVAEIMNLRNLNDEIKEMLVRKSLKSRDFLRELCKIDQEKQAQAINDFLLKKKENKKVKVSRSIKTKSKVLDIYLNNNILEVNINKIEQLAVSQKEEFVNIMRSVIQDINNA